jgi:hypothetical protein
MCKLTKTFGQLNKDGSVNTLNVDVDYNEKDNTVTEILYVTAYCSKGHFIDLTGIFALGLNSHLEKIISEVDWREIYREEKVSKAA